MEPLVGGLDGCPAGWVMVTTPADRDGPFVMLHNDWGSSRSQRFPEGRCRISVPFWQSVGVDLQRH